MLSPIGTPRAVGPAEPLASPAPAPEPHALWLELLLTGGPPAACCIRRCGQAGSAAVCRETAPLLRPDRLEAGVAQRPQQRRLRFELETNRSAVDGEVGHPGA